MIDISYYRKIQNAYGASSLQETKIQQIKMALNNDFDKPLDCFTVLVDGVEKDLTIIETNNLDEKKIKARPNTTFQSGQIVEWMNWYWIITKVNRRNDIITNGKMKECTYHLYWQDSTGKIVDKWAFTQSASSYSNGETGNSTLTLASNQFLVVMPKDEDTINLENTRIIIDNRTNDKPTPYKLTRPDNVSIDYGNGCTYYIFTLDQRGDSDKKITLDDGTPVWICNYITPPTPPEPDENPDKTTVFLTISSTKDTIKVGGVYTSFKGAVTDEYGNVTDDVGTFSIVADCTDSLTTNDTTPNQIKIKAADDCFDLVGDSFELVFTVEDVSTSKTITIKE